MFFKGIAIKGIITRVESKDYYLIDEYDHSEVRSVLPGRFKNEFNLKKDKLYATDIVVVGDKVEFNLQYDGTGVIENIFERKNYLSRKAPKIKGASYRGERLEQIIASNLDNVFVISSFKDPKFNNKTIDRFLAASESSGIHPKLIFNKTDLADKSEMKKWEELYTEIGYQVYLTSTFDDTDFDNIKNQLIGKINLFWGPSGVGKSSILNKLFPGLNLKVEKISSYTSKGTHTTVTSILIPVDTNTFIIDTPGVREIDPYGIRKEDLSHYFIEFKEFINDCKFNTCTHNHEPGCAVMEAVDESKISNLRYQSYLNILETVEEGINF